MSQVSNMATKQVSCTHSCRFSSSSKVILSSLISACRLSTVGSSLKVTVLLSTRTLGGAGRTGGGVLGRRSGFGGVGRRFSVVWNDFNCQKYYCTFSYIEQLFELKLMWFHSYFTQNTECYKPFASQPVSPFQTFLVLHLSGPWRYKGRTVKFKCQSLLIVILHSMP